MSNFYSKTIVNTCDFFNCHFLQKISFSAWTAQYINKHVIAKAAHYQQHQK